MATSLKTIFSTDEKFVAQADIKLIESMVKSFVVEFDQEKFKEFLFSGSKNPKATRQYRRVFSETRSQVSSETSPKVACAIAHNASSAIFSEVLKTSRVARTTRVNVSQETRRASTLAHRQNNDESQSRHLSSLQTPQFQIVGGS